MTPKESDPSQEWQRLAAVSSMADVISHHVENLALARAEDQPDWLHGLGVPAGWRVARIDGDGVAPSRIAVCGERPRGGWEGCDTVTVFGFTGWPPVDVVRDAADCTLRDLGAEGVTTRVLTTPPVPGVIAVRSSGHFTAAGRHMWAQYSNYVAGSAQPRQGLFIEHAIFVESRCRSALGDDITALSHAVQHAFVAEITSRR